MATLHQLHELCHVVNELVCVWDEVLWEDKQLPLAFSRLHCQIVLREVAVDHIRNKDIIIHNFTTALMFKKGSLMFI